MGVLAWVRRHLVAFAALVVLLYLLIPNIVVAVFSFNDPVGKFNYNWSRFSTDAWANPCASPGICESVGLSLRIGVTASLVATVLGTMVAFALGRYRFRGRAGTNLLIFVPMATPEVVMGSSLLTLFLMLGIPSGGRAILIAHIMFCLSFVVVTVRARLQGMDSRLEQAAMDLYATEAQAFWKVTFPLVFPGILSAALLAFALSFDDFIVTNFNSGQTVTFPMYVWGVAQRDIPMQINVIGTAMFLVAVTAVLVGELTRSRRQRVR
jgi:spermidine/putrescine transport system permease protein